MLEQMTSKRVSRIKRSKLLGWKGSKDGRGRESNDGIEGGVDGGSLDGEKRPVLRSGA